jgi:dTDP-4-dehydrorhamnose reductase
VTHERPETDQRKLLVTGASGFLGWHICRAAIPSWNVISLFEDEIRTPVSGAVAAEGLLLMLENGVRGVIHLGGRERISRYAFGLKLAETFGLPSDSIQKVKLAEIAMPAQQPRAPSHGFSLL